MVDRIEDRTVTVKLLDLLEALDELDKHQHPKFRQEEWYSRLLEAAESGGNA